MYPKYPFSMHRLYIGPQIIMGLPAPRPLLNCLQVDLHKPYHHSCDWDASGLSTGTLVMYCKYFTYLLRYIAACSLQIIVRKRHPPQHVTVGLRSGGRARSFYNPVHAEHLCSIYPGLDQRRRRWAYVV